MARRSEFDVTVGERVARLRKLRDLSMKELADRAGYVSPETISKIEANAGFRRGRREGTPTNARAVTIRDLLALARALNVSPLDLMLPLEDLAEVEIPTSPPYKARAWLVRSWISGNGPLDDQDEAEYFAVAPESSQRRHAAFRHPVIGLLRTLKDLAERAIGEDFGNVEPRLMASSMRENVALLAEYVDLLARETEMKEASDGQS